MSDHAMDQIRRANPIATELAPLPVDEIWRRIEADTTRPRLEQRAPPPRAWRPSIGGMGAAISVLVTVGVAVVALALLGHHRSTHNPRKSTTQPSGHGGVAEGVAIESPTATASGAPGTAMSKTVTLAATARDPRGGLAWAMRTFQTTGGQTCVQIGRLEDDTIGVIGQDGAFANDHLFHPIVPNAERADDCVETDGSGHAFENVTRASVLASADIGPETTSFVGCGIAGAHGDPCQRADLRVVQYGLLGPDASHITYLGPQGQQLTEPTAGPDGAYLIVDPATKQICRATPAGSRCGHEASGQLSAGPPLSAGLLTAVTYRDGHTCRVPPALPAGTPTGTPQASCPIVGYRPPPSYHFTALVGRVTARRIGSQPIVEISFVAPVPVTNLNSYYQYTLNSGLIGRSSCSYQAGDDTGAAQIKAGQRVILQDHIKPKCSGALSGTVSYVPNVGPGGSEYPAGFRPRNPQTITVGHFNLTLP
jgi:hypothetical protein